MKKIIGALVAISLVLTAFVQSFASTPEITLDAKYNVDTKALEISGIYSRGAGRVVNFIILPSDKDISEFNYTEIDKTENLVFSKQTNASGEFSDSLMLPTDFLTNEYNIFAISGAMSAKKSFIYLNSDITDNILKSAVGKTEAEFSAIIYDNAESLGIAGDNYYSSYSFINQFLYNFAPSTGYTNGEFTKAYYEALPAALYAGGKIEFSALVSDYGDNIGVNATDYEKLTADEKTKIEELIKNSDLTKNKISTLYSSNILLIKLVAADGYETLKSIMLEKSDDLELYMKDYNSINNSYYENLVFQDVYKQKNTTVEGFVSGFKKYAAKRLSEKSNADNKNSSGGGGGGSSSNKSIATVTPVVTPQPGKEEEISTVTYEDMANHWAKNEVSYLSEKNIVNGANGKFRPDDSITRAEFTKIVVGAFNLETKRVDKFKDVSSDSWYYEYIGTAAENGIVEGAGDEFRPLDTIKREDICVIAYRCLGSNNVKLEVGSQSVEDVSDYAREAVSAMLENGLVSGDERGFRPKDTATRAEASKIIYSILKYLEK